MKKYFISLLILLASVGASYAQSSSKFGVELQTSPFSIGLGSDKNGLTSGTLGINAIYSPIDRLSLRVGFEGLQLSQSSTKTYGSISLLRVGAGYVFYNDTKRNTLWEVNVSAGNDLKEFGKFTNIDVTGNVRFYIKEAFYMGLGAKHMRLKSVSFVNSPEGNTNLFFLAGYKFRF